MYILERGSCRYMYCVYISPPTFCLNVEIPYKYLYVNLITHLRDRKWIIDLDIIWNPYTGSTRGGGRPKRKSKKLGGNQKSFPRTPPPSVVFSLLHVYILILCMNKTCIIYNPTIKKINSVHCIKALFDFMVFSFFLYPPRHLLDLDLTDKSSFSKWWLFINCWYRGN